MEEVSTRLVVSIHCSSSWALASLSPYPQIAVPVESAYNKKCPLVVKTFWPWKVYISARGLMMICSRFSYWRMRAANIAVSYLLWGASTVRCISLKWCLFAVSFLCVSCRHFLIGIVVIFHRLDSWWFPPMFRLVIGWGGSEKGEFIFLALVCFGFWW